MFTQRHYKAIAHILLNEDPIHLVMQGRCTPEQIITMQAQHKATVLALANLFTADSDKFDRARFLAACGVKP